MKVDLGIWTKLTWAAIILGLVAGLVLVAGWYLPLIKQNERMRKEIFALNDQIQKEEKTAHDLKTSIDAIRRDPKTVERLTREKLGYAKPGEIVIRFEPPAASNATSN